MGPVLSSRPLGMTAFNPQPSPFGHLTRERHIQSLGSSQRKEDGASGHQAKQTSPSREGTSQAKQAQEAACGCNRQRVEPALWAGANAPCRAEFSGCEFTSRRHEPAEGEAVQSPPGWQGRRAQRRSPEQSSPWVHEVEGVVPAGLQLLAGVSQLHVTCQAQPRGFSGDPGRTYVVGTAQAKRLLIATEETSRLCLHLCGPARACHVRLQDLQGREVLWLRRPFGAGYLGCCQTAVQVFAGDRLLGSVRQRWGLLAHRWDVRDPHGAVTMRVCGSCIASRCCSNQEFQVTSRAGNPVAVIWKRWPGFNEDQNMDHEFFGLDMSAMTGAEDTGLLLATAFLLNFTFFEMS